MIIQITDTLYWDDTKVYYLQDFDSLQYIQELINSNTPVINSEDAGEGFERPLTKIYSINNLVITELFEYNFPADSREWGSVKSYNLEVTNG